MTRLLSIVVLASLLGGFATAETAGPQAGGSPAAFSIQVSGDSGGPMVAMDCGACASMGACIAPGPAQSAGLGISRLLHEPPLSQLSDQVRAPDTAPPKHSSS